jgi:protein phosphatase
VLRPDGAWLAHVGDSRAYRIRNGIIEQLTYDHSYVWEYARQVGKDPDDVQDFPHNIIHRCLGPRPSSELTIDIEGPHPIQPGDIFLMCSDGLSGQVDDPEMGVVASVLPPEEACRFLIDLANLRGGPDNITVIVVRVEGNGAVTAALTAHPARPLWQRVSWPVQSLLGGTFLAGVAIVLQMAWHSGGLAGLLFLLAVGPIIAGVIGMIVENKRKKNAVPDEEQVARIYRSKPCRLDKVLLEKLSKAEKTLRQRAEEQQWAPDLPTYEQHHVQAEQLAKEGNLPAAFREYCRAMRPLTAALHKHRSKEEVFQPVWDKST